MSWTNVANWFRGDRADGLGGGGIGGGGGGQGPRIYQPEGLPPIPRAPNRGQVRARPLSVSSRDGLINGGVNPGTMPPPGTDPDKVYMLDVDQPSDQDRKEFFDLLSSTMGTQKEIMKYVDEILTKLMGTVSLYRVG